MVSLYLVNYNCLEDVQGGTENLVMYSGKGKVYWNEMESNGCRVLSLLSRCIRTRSNQKRSGESF